MDRINFEDGVTKVNEETFNSFQNNIEKSCVALSTTQPTTTEKVWIKKGKNLLNPTNLYSFNNMNITINNQGTATATQVEADTGTTSSWKIQSFKGTTFVSQIEQKTITSLGTYSFSFQKSNSFDSIRFGINGSTMDSVIYFDVGYLENGNNYTVSFEVTNLTQGSASFTNIQLERGLEASSYENYIPTDIYLKTSNNAFFKTNMGIESGTNQFGSWVKYPDGTLICRGRVIREGDSESVNTWQTFPVSFVDNAYKVTLTNTFYYSYSIIWSVGVTETGRFSAYPLDVTTNASPTVRATAEFIAIGRWK